MPSHKKVLWCYRSYTNVDKEINSSPVISDCETWAILESVQRKTISLMVTELSEVFAYAKVNFSDDTANM